LLCVTTKKESTTGIIKLLRGASYKQGSCRVYKQSVIHLCEFDHFGA
jgi:hypothetical protein